VGVSCPEAAVIKVGIFLILHPYFSKRTYREKKKGGERKEKRERRSEGIIERRQIRGVIKVTALEFNTSRFFEKKNKKKGEKEGKGKDEAEFQPPKSLVQAAAIIFDPSYLRGKKKRGGKETKGGKGKIDLVSTVCST